MSRRLAYEVEIGRSYLHSPVDDLESCFWVAFWSVLFNKDHEKLLSIDERMMKEFLAQNYNSQAADAFNSLWAHKELSNIMQRFWPTLHAWWRKVQDRPRVWGCEVLAKAPEGAGEEYYLPHFHLFALQGVVDVLEVMSEHWNGEIGWKSWVAPALPATSG